MHDLDRIDVDVYTASVQVHCDERGLPDELHAIHVGAYELRLGRVDDPLQYAVHGLFLVGQTPIERLGQWMRVVSGQYQLDGHLNSGGGWMFGHGFGK